MSEHAVTRRSFLAGTAGMVALGAASGYIGFNAWQQAQAEASVEHTAKQIHTLCNACSSKCGFTAYVVDGKLTKLIGDENHPSAKGKLCARGYGYSQIAYSEDRITEPLKKTKDGSFEPISWEQAYEEIAEKVRQIKNSAGAKALAYVHDPRPTGQYYGPRFMKALGSPNVYTHGAACNLSKASGFTQVIGASDYLSDVANSKMTMFIGRSYADAIKPSSLAGLQKAHENGAHIVLVDPRCNNSITFANEWVPINPGTDLALVLAMAHVLIQRERYDKQYVKDNTIGFEDWAASIADHTPEWAETITGIPANTIERLALTFADAAPAASIEPSWRGAFGCAYGNSGETARAICAFNTLLGCWNKKGGALFTPSASAGTLDENKFLPLPKITEKAWGAEEYPLALSSMGVNGFAAEKAASGDIKGMFFYNSNMVAGYSNPAYLQEALSKLELMVAIDVQMSETAQLAHYVLPECSYLERDELPDFIGGMVPSVALRSQVLDRIHPNTKSADEIFTDLATACGIGEYFNFTQQELIDAQLATVGLSAETLREVGTVQLHDKAFTYDSPPKFNTKSGKIELSSDSCVNAGYSATPVWVKPQVMPFESQYRLIGGKQAVHSHTSTVDIPELMNISKAYGLDAIWLNADEAKRLNINDGDTVVLENEHHSGQVKVKVTQRINPTAIYLPSHYGCTSSDLKQAYGVGLRQMDYVPHHLESGYGSTMSQETLVSIRKVGA